MPGAAAACAPASSTGSACMPTSRRGSRSMRSRSRIASALLVYADRVLSAGLPDRGLRAVTRLRRALETLETERGESNPLAAAIQVRRMLRHRGLVVWLTDLADPARTEQLMQALKALVPRHQPIVAAPHAAEIDAARGEPAARVARSRRRARGARTSRARAARRWPTLRRQGVVVLDEPDDRLDQAVLDAYLQLRKGAVRDRDCLLHAVAARLEAGALGTTVVGALRRNLRLRDVALRARRDRIRSFSTAHAGIHSDRLPAVPRSGRSSDTRRSRRCPVRRAPRPAARAAASRRTRAVRAATGNRCRRRSSKARRRTRPWCRTAAGSRCRRRTAAAPRRIAGRTAGTTRRRGSSKASRGSARSRSRAAMRGRRSRAPGSCGCGCSGCRSAAARCRAVVSRACLAVLRGSPRRAPRARRIDNTRAMNERMMSLVFIYFTVYPRPSRQAEIARR